jgi:hypothetical protein
MDELVKAVSQKTGLSEDQSRKAVIDYLKKKLPAPIVGQIDGVLSNSGTVKNVADQAKGLFGKKWSTSKFEQGNLWFQGNARLAREHSTKAHEHTTNAHSESHK